MRVFFGITNKRRNSTLIPTIALGANNYYATECALKEGTSITSPVFKVAQNGITTPFPNNHNYCRVEGVGWTTPRYYFIKDWTFNPPFWEASCEIDVLATYAATIKASEQYILRAENGYSGKIMDTLPPTITTHTNTTLSASKGFFGSADYYVLQTVGITGVNYGTATHYVLTQEELDKVTSFLLSDTDWLNISDVSAELQKGLINPMQYILSCRYYPWDLSVFVFDESRTNVRVGFWDSGVTVGRTVATRAGFQDTITTTISVPKHPQAATLGEFLNLAPYSRYCLECYPFGVIPIDATYLPGVNEIKLTLNVDLMTGDGRLLVETAGGTFITERFGKVGIPTPLAQVTTDVLGTATSAISAVGGTVGAALSGNVAGAITNAVTGIANTVAGAFPQCEVSGNVGSLAFTDEVPKLHGDFQHIKDIPANIFGKPVCEYDTLSNHSGYVKCATPVISINGSIEEQEQIENYLSGGVYIE